MSIVAPLLQCMVELAMERRWDSTKFKFICFVILILGWQLRGSLALNLEGMTLMKIRTRIYLDPYNSLASWNPNDDNPCNWLGINCIDNEVQALLLHNNHFSGSIPTEFGYLRNLEGLDLRNNNLTGKVPTNIAKMKKLKQLLLSGNNFEGPIPLEIQRASLVYEFQFDEDVASIVSPQVEHWQKHPMKFWLDRGKDHIGKYQNAYTPKMYDDQVQQHANMASRRLDELTSNLEAVPATVNSLLDQVTSPPPIYLSSGSFPVIIKDRNISQTTPPASPPPDPGPRQVNRQDPTANPKKRSSLGKLWVYVIVSLALSTLLSFCIIMIFVWRRKGKKRTRQFKTGISGQLQRALTSGVVPQLNRIELETACEEFSNIIATFENFTIYKGTLSSGVEIAVASTMVKTSLDWSQSDEFTFQKKIQTLSRVNHKNYVNVLGYCAEDEPFTRMMVHEYASSGSLFEHLHVKEAEHLDWNTRLRVIMGVTYCLQHMHHDLHPPIVHSGLRSTAIYLTDDFAAKIVERPFEVKIPNISSENGSTHSDLISVDPKENVFEFGVLLLEIITGRLPCCEEQGSLIDWATPYLENKEKYKDMVDPSLKSVKIDILEVICNIIQDCLKQDPMERPSIKEISCWLYEAIPIRPDQAVPQLSPLWWAELEILSESN